MVFVVDDGSIGNWATPKQDLVSDDVKPLVEQGLPGHKGIGRVNPQRPLGGEKSAASFGPLAAKAGLGAGSRIRSCHHDPVGHMSCDFSLCHKLLILSWVGVFLRTLPRIIRG